MTTDLICAYAGNINVYNVRDYNANYPMGGLPNWLNSAAVKTMINVPQKLTWVSCTNDIYNWMIPDIMQTQSPTLTYVIDNIKTMIYNGQDDLIVNTPSTEAMINGLSWIYVNNFQQAPKNVWHVNGAVAGYAQNYNLLTFVWVLQSGHMVPYDQPVNARNMVYRFINNQGWN